MAVKVKTAKSELDQLFKTSTGVLKEHFKRHEKNLKVTKTWDKSEAQAARVLSAQVVSLGQLWLRIRKADLDDTEALSTEEKLETILEYLLSVKEQHLVWDLAHALMDHVKSE